MLRDALLRNAPQHEGVFCIRPVRAGKKDSDAGLWEIIQTGRGEEEG
jgi:hypothetical protein